MTTTTFVNLQPGDPAPWFRQRAVELISYHIRYQRAFEASRSMQSIVYGGLAIQ